MSGSETASRQRSSCVTLGEIGLGQVSEQADQHVAAPDHHLGEVGHHAGRQGRAVLVQLDGRLLQHQGSVLHVVDQLSIDVPHEMKAPLPRVRGAV